MVLVRKCSCSLKNFVNYFLLSNLIRILSSHIRTFVILNPVTSYFVTAGTAYFELSKFELSKFGLSKFELSKFELQSVSPPISNLVILLAFKAWPFFYKKNFQISDPFRAVIVVHPFVRLASVFLDLENQNEFSKNLKSEIQKFSSNSEKIDFKTFVRFLLEGNLGSSQRSGKEETETKKLLRKLLPYHYQCQVCHTGLLTFFCLIHLK